MAILMYGAPGALWNCWGKCGLLVKALKSFQTAQQGNLLNAGNGLYGQLNNEQDVQAIVGNNYIGALAGSDSSFPNIAGTVAAAYASRLVFRDNPQFNQNLTQANTLTSLIEIIRQMRVQGATVLAMTVGATPSQFTSNNVDVGNGAVVASVRRPLDGRVLENAFAESVRVACTSDSYVGGRTAFNERFTITGAGAERDLFAFDWPLGSNGSLSVSAADGDTDFGANNLLSNSGFTTWSGGLPSNWAFGAGSASVTQESSLVFSAGSALKFAGNGGTLLSLSQEFGASAGTPGTLDPVTQYSWCGWLRRGGAPVSAGTMIVELIDGAGAVINDQAGTANSFSIDLTALSTTYTASTGVFRTPEAMPAQQSVRYRFSVAPNAGSLVYLDKTGMGLMSQLYTSGPFVNVHSGSIPFVQGDLASVTISNSRGAAGTLSTFQTLMAQLFGGLVYGNEIIFPSSTVPTISDTLIG